MDAKCFSFSFKNKAVLPWTRQLVPFPSRGLKAKEVNKYKISSHSPKSSSARPVFCPFPLPSALLKLARKINFKVKRLMADFSVSVWEVWGEQI